ncbi:MAG: hypothetical protein ACRD0K_13255 [Egibacteraceae bacterium]
MNARVQVAHPGPVYVKDPHIHRLQPAAAPPIEHPDGSGGFHATPGAREAERQTVRIPADEEKLACHVDALAPRPAATARSLYHEADPARVSCEAGGARVLVWI